MGQQIRSSFKAGHISRRVMVSVIAVYAILMAFASIHFSTSVFLYDNVPILLISITMGCIGGLIYNWFRLEHYRLFDRPPRVMLKDFFMATCVFSLLGSQLPAAAVYFMPGEMISYTAPYQTVMSTLSASRLKHCSVEVKFEDQNLGRTITLCMDKARIPTTDNPKDLLAVTEKVTDYGVKITTLDITRAQ